jgi:hypothetical protein
VSESPFPPQHRCEESAEHEEQRHAKTMDEGKQNVVEAAGRLAALVIRVVDGVVNRARVLGKTVEVFLLG